MAKQSPKTIIIEIVVLIIIVVAIVLYLSSRGIKEEVSTNTDVQTTVNIEVVNSTSVLPEDTQVVVVSDKDGDGISDEREGELKTNPSLADSDNDGLTDYDEVHVYQSNPLMPDTDGDGNNDGTEVQNGYSPTDDSALLDFEREKQKFNE